MKVQRGKMKDKQALPAIYGLLWVDMGFDEPLLY